LWDPDIRRVGESPRVRGNGHCTEGGSRDESKKSDEEDIGKSGVNLCTGRKERGLGRAGQRGVGKCRKKKKTNVY